jgi:thiamine-phosphate pyrophosphorylase
MKPSQRTQPKNKNADLGDDAYRIIDANINRAKEGLRVCEEICRFHLKDPASSQGLNRRRHRLTAVIKKACLEKKKLFECRDADTDVGKKFAFGPRRKSFRGIFLANAQRVKEALRVLEEFLKINDTRTSSEVQKLRFDFYAFEKEIVAKFPSLLDP